MPRPRLFAFAIRAPLSARLGALALWLIMLAPNALAQERAEAPPGPVLSADSRSPGAGNHPADSRSQQAPFATRHARYSPAAWGDIPGWVGAATPTAWTAFLRGCGVLARRPAWAPTCQRASSEQLRSPEEIRRFFESEFEAFQVQATDHSDPGILTGYFEPLLEGSTVRTARFQYPVHGVPRDLLFLDARLLKPSRRGYARIEGRDVIPVPESAPSLSPQPGPDQLRLALDQAPPDLRDRKIRVRREGDRIVPYFTRQEIEQHGADTAPPIAWVDDRDLLYVLHIQGSGRIRLPSGETLRVAFGEQNGHPFIPKVRVGSSETVRTRGIGTPPSGPALERSAEVQRVIDLLLAQAAGANARPAKTPATPPAASNQPSVPARLAQQPAQAKAAPRPSAAPPSAVPAERQTPPQRPPVFVSSEGDPSYVFFRQISDTGGGPPGALGVPLTPKRSLAVDPRVTPLGAPVFIAARRPGSGEENTELMVAQDTGGAIRGAVRADYFWGFGPSAGVSAMRMKDALRMWVLLPKGLDLASRHTEVIRTRGLDSNAQVECLLADPELCVE